MHPSGAANPQYLIIPSTASTEEHVRYQNAFCSLRYQVFVEELGWENPFTLFLVCFIRAVLGIFRAEWKSPCHKETDRYDRTSDFLLMEVEGQVVAGCRIIKKGISSLPIERYIHQIRLSPDAVEISRMICLKAYRHHMSGFYRFALQYGKGLGVTIAYVSIRERYLRRLQKGGFHCFERIPGRAFLKKTRRRRRKTLERFIPVLIHLDRLGWLQE